MNADQGWLTANELVERLGKDELSTWQLEAWHKQGLLTPPRHIHLGKGKGTESRYSPGTLGQIREILRLKREKHIRRLADIRVWLWLEKYPVKTGLIKKDLASGGEWADQLNVNTPQEVPDRVEQLVKKARSSRIPGGLNKDEYQFRGILAILVNLVSGFPINFDPASTDDYDTAVFIEDRLGLAKARVDKPAPNQPWLSGVPGDFMQRMSRDRIIYINDIKQSINGIPDERLEKVRENIYKLVTYMPALKIMAGALTSRFGAAMLERTVKWGEKNISVVLFLVNYYEYRHLSLAQILPAIQSLAVELQGLPKLSKEKQARANRKLRRKIDRQL